MSKKLTSLERRIENLKRVPEQKNFSFSMPLPTVPKTKKDVESLKQLGILIPLKTFLSQAK